MTTSEGIALTRQLFSLMESTPALTEIDFICGDTHISLSGNHSSVHAAVVTTPDTAPAAPSASGERATRPDIAVINAELHGIFYHSPLPELSPLWKSATYLLKGSSWVSLKR